METVESSIIQFPSIPEEKEKISSVENDSTNEESVASGSYDSPNNICPDSPVHSSSKGLDDDCCREEEPSGIFVVDESNITPVYSHDINEKLDVTLHPENGVMQMTNSFRARGIKGPSNKWERKRHSRKNFRGDFVRWSNSASNRGCYSNFWPDQWGDFPGVNYSPLLWRCQGNSRYYCPPNSGGYYYSWFYDPISGVYYPSNKYCCNGYYNVPTKHVPVPFEKATDDGEDFNSSSLVTSNELINEPISLVGNDSIVFDEDFEKKDRSEVEMSTKEFPEKSILTPNDGSMNFENIEKKSDIDSNISPNIKNDCAEYNVRLNIDSNNICRQYTHLDSSFPNVRPLGTVPVSGISKTIASPTYYNFCNTCCCCNPRYYSNFEPAPSNFDKIHTTMSWHPPTVSTVRTVNKTIVDPLSVTDNNESIPVNYNTSESIMVDNLKPAINHNSSNNGLLFNRRNSIKDETKVDIFVVENTCCQDVGSNIVQENAECEAVETTSSFETSDNINTLSEEAQNKNEITKVNQETKVTKRLEIIPNNKTEIIQENVIQSNAQNNNSNNSSSSSSSSDELLVVPNESFLHHQAPDDFKNVVIEDGNVEEWQCNNTGLKSLDCIGGIPNNHPSSENNSNNNVLKNDNVSSKHEECGFVDSVYRKYNPYHPCIYTITRDGIYAGPPYGNPNLFPNGSLGPIFKNGYCYTNGFNFNKRNNFMNCNDYNFGYCELCEAKKGLFGEFVKKKNVFYKSNSRHNSRFKNWEQKKHSNKNTKKMSEQSFYNSSNGKSLAENGIVSNNDENNNEKKKNQLNSQISKCNNIVTDESNNCSKISIQDSKEKIPQHCNFQPASYNRRINEKTFYRRGLSKDLNHYKSVRFNNNNIHHPTCVFPDMYCSVNHPFFFNFDASTLSSPSSISTNDTIYPLNSSPVVNSPNSYQRQPVSNNHRLYNCNRNYCNDKQQSQQQKQSSRNNHHHRSVSGSRDNNNNDSQDIVVNSSTFPPLSSASNNSSPTIPTTSPNRKPLKPAVCSSPSANMRALGGGDAQKILGESSSVTRRRRIMPKALEAAWEKLEWTSSGKGKKVTLRSLVNPVNCNCKSSNLSIPKKDIEATN